MANVELKGSTANAEVKLGDLGAADLENDVKLTAEEVAQGLTIGNISSQEDIEIKTTGTKLIGDTTKSIASTAGDVKVDIDSNEAVVLNSISATVEKLEVKVESYGSTTLGAIAASSAVVDFN